MATEPESVDIEAQESEAERHRLALEEEARRRQHDEDLAQGFMADFMTLLENLFRAIFGSFVNLDDRDIDDASDDTQSEDRIGQDDISRRVAASDFRGRYAADLAALASQYQGVRLTNPSPLEGDTVATSDLGHRDRPAPGASTDHKGIDLQAAEGTPVYNTMPGIVVRSTVQRNDRGQVSGFGQWIEVACIDGSIRRYAHLSSREVRVGQVVHQGDLLGLSGSSGVGTGPHLHYEWRDSNNNVLEPTINNMRFGRDGEYAVNGQTRNDGYERDVPIRGMDRSRFEDQRAEVTRNQEFAEAGQAPSAPGGVPIVNAPALVRAYG